MEVGSDAALDCVGRDGNGAPTVTFLEVESIRDDDTLVVACCCSTKPSSLPLSFLWPSRGNDTAPAPARLGVVGISNVTAPGGSFLVVLDAMAMSWGART